MEYIVVTLCQQGGIGYPPVIIKVKGRWYFISDSRDKVMPLRIVDKVKREKKHTQIFALKKMKTAPRLTWEEVSRLIEKQPPGQRISWQDAGKPK